MARSKRTPQTESPELEPKPRRKKKTHIAEALDDLKEQIPTLQVAAELDPPEREVIQPEPNVDRPSTARAEYPMFEEKLAHQRASTRPTAPRKRDGEPAASFASEAIRITLQDRVWQVEARRELTGNEKDRLAASGFQAVDDDEKVWNAPQAELRRRGSDINVIAFDLSGKAARGR
jgi:hypothetical protein